MTSKVAGPDKSREEHARAANRLLEHAELILAQWAQAIRDEEPIARKLDAKTLRNNLPFVLEQTAAVLAAGEGEDVYAYAKIPDAREHARQRAGLEGFTLDLVIKEYHLLRRIMVQVMEQEGPLSWHVVQVLNDAVDRAMEEAAVYFEAENERIRREHESQRRTLTQQLITAQEAERQRLSRDLHDLSGQRLTTLSLQLETFESLCPPESKAAAVCTQLKASVTELAHELHEVSQQLRPLLLEDLGLCHALASLLQDTEARSSVQTDFHHLGEPCSAPPEIETMMFRVAQEAVTNVLRHAAATKISVVFEQRPGELRLIVEDDGRGFDAEGVLANSGRLGLRGMRERALLLGGALEIESSPGQGTTLFIRVALPDKRPS